ncbi:MAG: tetratricopeptide repeat protein [Bacteroidales bacterium]|nr:tetratricopeptide repeat protein [Bacteroidales bacterium]
MTIITTSAIALYVADKILGQLIVNKVFGKKKPTKEYRTRLSECISNTIIQYEENNPVIDEKSKFPFYHSQILLDSLSRYMLFEDGSAELLERDFEKNPNIIKPGDKQLSDFYNLFLEKASSDKVLKDTFIEAHYKKKVFENSFKIDKILNKVDAIKKDTETILERLPLQVQRDPSKELTVRLPLLLSDKIVERKADLTDIRNRLLQNKQLVLVNGMGGIGKTTLAQIYLTEYYNQYKHLVWISINSDDFIADFINTAGLKESLQIPIENKTAQDYFNQIITALKGLFHKSNEQSLIIIDNAEENITQFRDDLPHPPNWHILTTSRHKIEELDVKELDFFNEEQAVELFKLYYTRLDLSDRDIEEIVKELEYHTLTIEILAKTAQNDGLNVLETVNIIAENYQVEVDVRHAHKKIDRITSYLSSIFDMSKLGEEEMWLLKQLYFLPAQFHEYKTIKEILSPAIGNKPYKIQKILSKLVAKGWCLCNKTTYEYKLHRIIGDVIKHSVNIAFEDISPLIESISTLLSIDDTKDNPIDKFKWAIFGTNLLQKNPFGEEAIVATLQNNLALRLQDLGDYTGAKHLLEKAKIFAEKNFGEDHPTTAGRYSNLALVLQDLGDYNGAKLLLEKAKISAEKNFGEDHPTTAGRYSNLALVLKALGDYNGAKLLLEKAKISDEKNFGEDHPTTAVSYSNLASLLHALGDYNGAKHLYEKAKISAEKNFGEDHPTTAVRYSNLALVLEDLGDYGGAKHLLEKAKISTEKNFGEAHPTTAVSYSNLATVLRALGDYTGAKHLFEKAKISNEKNFGEDHPTTAVSYSNLATVLKALGDYKAAKHLLEKAKISDEENFGEAHPTTAVSYSNLALVLQDLGDYKAAKHLLEKAKNIFDISLGKEHPNSVTVKENLDVLLDEIQNKNLL